MRQVVVIGGGETFDFRDEYLKFLKKLPLSAHLPSGEKRPKDWKANLQKHLGDKYEVLYLKMPSTLNATYEEWEIVFKKLVPTLQPHPILIGHSLGGAFLIKYLSRQRMRPVPHALILVSTPRLVGVGDYDIDFETYSDFQGRIQSRVNRVYILHSKDDKIVKFEDAKRLNMDLKPYSDLYEFEGRGHFIFEPKFPELVKLIKSL